MAPAPNHRAQEISTATRIPLAATHKHPLILIALHDWTRIQPSRRYFGGKMVRPEITTFGISLSAMSAAVFLSEIAV